MANTHIMTVGQSSILRNLEAVVEDFSKYKINRASAAEDLIAHLPVAEATMIKIRFVKNDMWEAFPHVIEKLTAVQNMEDFPEFDGYEAIICNLMVSLIHSSENIEDLYSSREQMKNDLQELKPYFAECDTYF